MVADEGSSPSHSKPVPSKELTTRVLSALVMVAAALLTAYWGGWPFALFWLAAGIAIVVEWTDMTGIEPRRLVQAVLGLGLAAFAASGAQMRVWVVSSFIYAVPIVLVPPMVRAHPDLGILGLLWMFAVVWATDIAAYFTGRTFGGPKLCPPISPKKTWSGFVGGVVAATAGGLLVAWIGQRYGATLPLGFSGIAALSIVASIASQVGDLGESALKRHCQVKDSSHLIPGHGGVMDRLDGFWAVCLIVLVLLPLAPTV
jgi:phosphatidate cytidylyltransferase